MSNAIIIEEVDGGSGKGRREIGGGRATRRRRVLFPSLSRRGAVLKARCPTFNEASPQSLPQSQSPRLAR